MNTALPPLTPPLTPTAPASTSTGPSTWLLPRSLSEPGDLNLDDPFSDSEDDEDDERHRPRHVRRRTDELADDEAEASGALDKGLGGKAKLRIVIVTENFLPKVDGVTRTLARLLEHLHQQGHEALVCGPETGMSHYSTHPLVGTLGIPLVVYPGLKLNFLRPKFMREIEEFNADIIHMVDPIWLGGQTLMGLELGWAGEKWVGEKGPGVGGGLRGAVVASYHTNLATYATLFGLPWLEPIIWVWQRWLYSKCRLYLCPSQSTMDMLKSHSLPDSRMWSRGVDLSHFNPGRRSAAMRASWGIVASPVNLGEVKGNGRKDGLPMLPGSGLVTPPISPELAPVGNANSLASLMSRADNERVAILYVGRISWEKNLMLLLTAYPHLISLLPSSTPAPKLVFVGEGPARADLETFCATHNIDATFMGHRTGEDLAECYASADIFGFPSFTETFGQVVLEALASGLPVVGLDAEGTRDLVSHSTTGLLLPLPSPAKDWPAALKSERSLTFKKAAEDYAALLARAVSEPKERRAMGATAASGTKGRTWFEAMELCVDSYREAITMSRLRAAELRQESLAAQAAADALWIEKPRPIRDFGGRVIGRLRRRRAGRALREQAAAAGRDGGGGSDGQGRERETLWKLKNLGKILVFLYLLYFFYAHLPALASSANVTTAAPALLSA